LQKSVDMNPVADVETRLNRRLRVLIIEDSADILFILKTELDFLGYTVEVARDAMRGLNIAQTFRPDVIVSDIGLPGIDGYELLMRIRQSEEFAAVPVIALTGFGSERDERQTRFLGFNAHVTKPVDGAFLSKVIDSVTAEKRASSSGI
jgi:CheY-like chemotaxis protein